MESAGAGWLEPLEVYIVSALRPLLISIKKPPRLAGGGWYSKHNEPGVQGQTGDRIKQW